MRKNPMKAISFLGTGKYQTVTYCWDNRDYQTALFPEALVELFDLDLLLLFVTPQVLSHPRTNQLCQSLGSRIQLVEIPEGKTEAELWTIFDRCTEHIEQGDRLLLDITHAFRTLPMIVFTAAAYLRYVKDVQIEHIIYGAFEARDAAERVPIIDLRFLLDLLDWISSATMMLRSGDATAISQQLRTIHRNIWKQGVSDRFPLSLHTAADKLNDFTHELHLARPRNVLRTAHTLVEKFDQLDKEAQLWAKPFAVIAGSIRRDLERIAHANTDQLSADNLRRELAMIEYLHQKHLHLQAITLAREWIVSFVAFYADSRRWLDRQYRDSISNTLNSSLLNRQHAPTPPPSAAAHISLEHVPNPTCLLKVWQTTCDLRNELAHCGMRRKLNRRKTIEDKLTQIIQSLGDLASELPPTP